MEFIEAHPEYPWDWKWISGSPNITVEFIDNHPDYPWDWGLVSENPNLTMEFIESHPEYPWDWNRVQTNKFTKNKELFMVEEARKFMAIYKIKQWWKEICLSPYTKVGKKLFNKSYDALFG